MTGRRTARSGVLGPTWQCDRCQTPLDASANDGSIYITYGEWHAFKDAEAEWNRQHAGDNGWIVATAAALRTFPIFRWHVEHDRCDAQIGRMDVYGIEVSRLDTWTKVANWSAHLHGKGWFADSEWDNLLYRAGIGAVAA